MDYRNRLAVFLAGWVLFPGQALGSEIPYWARQYGVTCSQCHVSVPRLNKFGGEFLARGYQMRSDTTFAVRRTVPLAVWISGRSDSRPPTATTGEHVTAYLNRVELISGGKVVAPWLSYFVEWRTVSKESRADGSLRDRSGRFEDVFVTAAGRNLAVTAGQLRQIDQVDVSRRLGISEPLSLSASLAGRGRGTSRERGLRAFSPSARSPLVRMAWQQKLPSWTWTTSAALPVPGEFSIPINDEARVEASNEIEWRRKGFFAESYARSGQTTVGVHAFYDDAQRYLSNAVTTWGTSSFYLTGIGGVAKSGRLLAGRWSVEGEYIPHPFGAFGTRIEDRAADGVKVALLPYINFSFPASSYTIRLTVERRIQKDRGGTFIELGTVF